MRSASPGDFVVVVTARRDFAQSIDRIRDGVDWADRGCWISACFGVRDIGLRVSLGFVRVVGVVTDEKGPE